MVLEVLARQFSSIRCVIFLGLLSFQGMCVCLAIFDTFMLTKTLPYPQFNLTKNHNMLLDC